MAEKRYRIAMVDDNAANLTIGRTILKEHYEVFPVPSSARLFDLLAKVSPDLILLDIMMPEMDGYETIKRLKADRRYESIPVIFLSAQSDESSELRGLAMGAVDYITKPFSAPLLLKRVENHLLISQQRVKLQNYNADLKQEVSRKATQLVGMQDAMLSAITEMVEFRDGDTGGHIDRTQLYLKWLIDELMAQGIYADLTWDWDVDLLVASAPLHDAGKIAISDAILRKPGKLTEDEFEIMKEHVDFGVEIIERIEARSDNCSNFLKFAKVIAASHHEKYDGSGYPWGLAGDEIPLEGRLMAIVDVYDALISRRPYKEAFPPEVAERVINEGSGAHFDPVLVGVFNNVSDKFANISRGSKERMSMAGAELRPVGRYESSHIA
ncbi:MAG: response regulator [Clostridiales Family XIII bacterium]|jgi:putative two-component system response regulator|nr:response regulator [Clostridiales Family XIII bacterium]